MPSVSSDKSRAVVRKALSVIKTVNFQSLQKMLPLEIQPSQALLETGKETFG